MRFGNKATIIRQMTLKLTKTISFQIQLAFYTLLAT
jgi:hypothetical protein